MYVSWYITKHTFIQYIYKAEKQIMADVTLYVLGFLVNKIKNITKKRRLVAHKVSVRFSDDPSHTNANIFLDPVKMVK